MTERPSVGMSPALGVLRHYPAGSPLRQLADNAAVAERIARRREADCAVLDFAMEAGVLDHPTHRLIARMVASGDARAQELLERAGVNHRLDMEAWSWQAGDDEPGALRVRGARSPADIERRALPAPRTSQSQPPRQWIPARAGLPPSRCSGR